MNLLPINLDIRGRKGVVVGGGPVAERKCRALLDAEATVTVVAPNITEGLASLARDGNITILSRRFRSGDLDGAFLAFSATDDREINRAVAAEASRLGILICVADAPEEGNFTSPSAIRQGDLLITVSTGGKSPALARKVRLDLESLYGPEYAILAERLGALREKLLTEGPGDDYYKQLFNDLLDRSLPELLNDAGTGKLDRLLRSCDLGRHRPADTEEST